MNSTTHRAIATLFTCASLVVCNVRVTSADDRLATAAQAIDADGLLGHIRVLSSDEFEGREPASPGEEKSVAYLVEQFKRLGLQPGNPDGTYVQEVPLVGFLSKATGRLTAGDGSIALDSSAAWTPVSRRFVPMVLVKGSDVVFVGYGIEAPEYGWDDYKGLDTEGKTLVMLVGDPPIPDTTDPTKLDDAMFKGRAMTYYGRWTYKYEIASKKKAAAVLLVHETGPAGYPYEVVQGSWSRENFDIASDGKADDRVVVESWISRETAGALCELTGKDFDALKRAALSKDHQPVPLGMKFSAEVENTIRQATSHNVVATVEGSDPKLKDEYVVFTAHWDHLGRDSTRDGDQIFNGAADNASGVAMMLELAQAAMKLEPKPKRSLVFLAVTAEEKGLLGAKYYAGHPLYPLEKTVANINMDVINLWGRTSDLSSVGMGQTTLDDLLVRIAGAHGRSVAADTEPEKGMYYRSDHFEFAKVGVPALNAKGGAKYIGKPEGYGKEKRDEYTKNDYHKPSDEVKADWDLSGAVEDARLLLELALDVAEKPSWPSWKMGSEFRARREAMLRPAK